MSLTLKDQFLLDPDVIFLNHGSFGACPRPVFEAYQAWQRELERQPVEFLGRRAAGLLAEARAALGAYVGAPADDLVFFTNPTMALNLAARSLNLQPDDEILTTDHEYPATDNMWDFLCAKAGARVVRQHIPLPLTTAEAFADALFAGVSRRTRAIFLSHITSSTALVLPVEEVCRRARAAGIPTIVDGAHAPAHVPLDLQALGADIYAATCHKWLCAPKGSAFLYARPEAQAWLEPLIVSVNWKPAYAAGERRFVLENEWLGTRDIAAFLAVPAAIQFQAEHDWEAQRRRCHELAVETRRRIDALTGLPALGPDDRRWLGQMVSVRLPAVDEATLKRRLYDEYRIEAPIITWRGQVLIRVSFQAYNDEADADALVAALGRLL